VLAQIQKDNPEEIRIVFRHLPLIGSPEQPFHDKAALAAQAAEAAGMQGKFWEMHDLLFERQDQWSAMSVDEFQTWLVEQALELELDQESFSKALVDKANVEKIQAAWDRAESVNLTFTPILLVNEKPVPTDLPLTEGNIKAIISLYALEERQFTSCPPMTVDGSKQYTATLHTEKGDIKIELFADKAPIAVNNFIFLANNGWFDSVTFHRVLPGFVAQSGDPSGTGFGGPGYAFTNEVSPDLKFDKPGLVGMANAGPDSNGSQFFITFAPTPDLDGGYTIFGQVTEGMDVAQKLTPRNPQESMDLPPGDKILSVDIEEK
jgi:cyclophilin family peptidyl-prolyl cis-trans isomerase